MKIGVISDTHGLLRPEALRALRGSALILHAGDIGAQAVLEELQQIAPVTAIRGNNDTQRWAQRIPQTIDVQVEGVRIHMLHSVNDLDTQAAAAASVIVSGHSHRPAILERGKVLYLNPGSAGPRRFKLPIAVALLSVNGDQARARIIELKL